MGLLHVLVEAYRPPALFNLDDIFSGEVGMLHPLPLQL